MTIDELAKDIRKAMLETYDSCIAADLSPQQAWDKMIVRAKARCTWLAGKHGNNTVSKAMEIVTTQFQKGMAEVGTLKENITEIAEGILATMDETYDSSLKAGLSHEQALEKVTACYDDKCASLTKEHSNGVVLAVLKTFGTLMTKRESEKEKK